MTVNIKKSRCASVDTGAYRSYRGMTAAVTEAVRERLARVRRDREAPRAVRLLAIGKDCADYLQEPARSVDHGDLLYGADGLPR
jgi:antitoxin VapB